MQAICVADILGNSYSVVLGRVIQYSSGEGTFSARVSSRVTISYSNTAGAVVSAALPRSSRPTCLMRTRRTPGEYQSHAKDSFFYFFSYTKVGLLITSSALLGLLAGC